MSKKSIFIAATGQHVGKTTICLGLIAALKKRYSQIGFIKPVGQQHVKIDNDIVVDKDTYLFKNHFEMEGDWHPMSPVIIPAGFTRRYFDENISSEEMLNDIITSYKSIASLNDYTVVEGTGHVGVGSILDLSNARVASNLGLETVIIASGGLGSAFDELAINIAMCKEYNVPVRGVILNRVLDEKREMILNYFPKALDKWGVPLIGCIPFDPFLSMPTVKDFEGLFQTTLFSGQQHRLRHFDNFRLFAGSVKAYKREFEPNQLIITPASREDIIMATLEKHLHTTNNEGVDYGGGMILTGRHSPSKSIEDQMRHVDIPILYAPMSSYDAMKKITTFIAKIRLEDTEKIQKAIHLVDQYVDLNQLCQAR
ncbi:MAG: AAA family ATPase [Chlamydiota bacterium]